MTRPPEVAGPAIVETPPPGEAPVPAGADPAGARGFGLADLALLFQSSIWAANYTVVKSALATVQPLAFNGLRMLTATLLFMLVAWLRRDSLRIARADLPRLALLAFLGHTAFQACFAVGLAQTTAASASLILALSPVMVALIAAARGEERLLSLAWLGMLASFGGVAVLVLASGGSVGLGGAEIVGDLIILAAAVSWAFYTVLSRPILRRYSSLQVNTLTIMLGVPPLLVLAAPQMVSQDWGRLAVHDWLAFGYATVMAIVVAYFIYSWGVQKIGPSRTAAYYNTTPPLAGLIAWVFGGEPLTLAYLAGAALILAGLYLVRRGTRATGGG